MDMARVKKRSGDLQEFDLRKLVESMKRAGASEQVAQQIATKAQTQGAEGAPTIELRKFVAEELHRVNEPLGEAYARTLRLRVAAAKDVKTGAARVPRRIERVPDVRPGMPARVVNGEKRTEVRIEPALDRREVWLNPDDLQTLGAAEGSRVAVRFLSEGTGTQPRDPSARQTQTAQLRP
jgi:hypothetical protein